MKKILLVLSAFAVMALGGDFEDGLAAYNNKDYKKAVKIFQKIAAFVEKFKGVGGKV